MATDRYASPEKGSFVLPAENAENDRGRVARLYGVRSVGHAVLGVGLFVLSAGNVQNDRDRLARLHGVRSGEQGAGLTAGASDTVAAAVVGTGVRHGAAGRDRGRATIAENGVGIHWNHVLVPVVGSPMPARRRKGLG